MRCLADLEGHWRDVSWLAADDVEQRWLFGSMSPPPLHHWTKKERMAQGWRVKRILITPDWKPNDKIHP